MHFDRKHVLGLKCFTLLAILPPKKTPLVWNLILCFLTGWVLQKLTLPIPTQLWKNLLLPRSMDFPEPFVTLFRHQREEPHMLSRLISPLRLRAGQELTQVEPQSSRSEARQSTQSPLQPTQCISFLRKPSCRREGDARPGLARLQGHDVAGADVQL